MSKTKKCHYISQVYLRYWCKDNMVDNVNVYNKVEKKIISGGFAIDNHFYVTNLYNILFSDTLTYLNQFPIIKQDFQNQIIEFQLENNIIIYYNKKPFSINEDNLGYLMDKENVDFKKDNEFVSNSKKNHLYNKLSQLKSTKIEEEYNKRIEVNWNKLVGIIHELAKEQINAKKISLNADEMQLLRKMTATMGLRIEGTPGFPKLSENVVEICNYFKGILKKTFQIDKAVEVVEDFPEIQFKKFNYTSLFDEGDSLIEKALFEKCKLNYELYIIDENSDLEFNTSDVPCFIHIANYEKENKNNAIYFPISPKMLLTLKKDTKLSNDINVYEVSANQVKFFNNLIYNHATKYIIYKNKWEE